MKPTSIFHGRSLVGQPISTRVAFMQGMLQHDHLVLSQKITNCINERSMVVSWGSYQLNSTLWISYTNDVFKACLPSQLKPIADCMKISCKESVVNDVPDGLIQAGARAFRFQLPSLKISLSKDMGAMHVNVKGFEVSFYTWRLDPFNCFQHTR